MANPSEQNAAIEAVVAAWQNHGPVPEYHYAMKSKLFREWPTLAEAVDALVYLD